MSNLVKSVDNSLPTLNKQDFNCESLCTAIRSNDISMLETILQQENKIELLQMVDKYGETPLHIAVWKGNADVVNTIFSTAGDIAQELLEIKDKDGHIPLELAVRRENVELIKAMISTKESCLTPAESAYTPLDVAAVEFNHDTAQMSLTENTSQEKEYCLQEGTCEQQSAFADDTLSAELVI